MAGLGAVRIFSKWRRVTIPHSHLHIWHPPHPPSPLSLDTEVTKVTAGLGFCAVYSSDRAWLLGENPPISSQRPGPLSVKLPEGRLIKQVAAGRWHVVVIATSGEAYSMGLNCFGQCGAEIPSPPDQLQPLKPVQQLPAAVDKVCCGLDHTLFLSQGRVFSCGWSEDGQTGAGCYGSVATPTPVTGELMTQHVRDIQSSTDSCLVATDTAQLFAWGNNEYGQLGTHSTDLQVAMPQRVECGQLDGLVVSIATGSTFSAILTRQGSIYYCGLLGGMGTEECSGEGEGERWKRLATEGEEERGGKEGKVVGIRAGMHYLAALEQDEVGNKRILLWGRHHGNYGNKLSPLPSELELPPNTLDWCIGPVNLTILLT